MPNQKNKRNDKIVKELEMPNNIEISFQDGFLSIKGPAGEVRRKFKQKNISIKTSNNKITLESKNGKKEDKKLMGSLTAHLNNMVKGSLKGHVYTLKICSGHFPMNVSVANNKLTVKNFLGEKVPRILQLKQAADVKIEGDLIYVTSPNKEIAGQISADIEQLTRRPRYDTRIFQDGCYIISKDGKELK
ncbi:50S ribosomal protein L6 [Candidatus Woesearchaeota archaeon]|nr:50S ribosomal protein L6 [Candidatus Woesearchaeota archaeon]